jgi:predicted DNA-binding transcriptional regulator AlpA
MDRITPEEALKMRRIYTSEVCALARWSRTKLARMRKEKAFPEPIDRGREAIYDAYEVLCAIGMKPQETGATENPWDTMLNAASTETDT